MFFLGKNPCFLERHPNFMLPSWQITKKAKILCIFDFSFPNYGRFAWGELSDTAKSLPPHLWEHRLPVTALALSARGLMKYTLAAKTERLNANSDYVDEKKVETTDQDEMKSRQKEDNKVEDFIPHLLSKNPESRTVREREPILVGPHDDSAENNKTMMKNPKNLDKKSKNKTMMKNPKNLDKKSESPLLFLDALRPRNDPLWNFRWLILKRKKRASCTTLDFFSLRPKVYHATKLLSASIEFQTFNSANTLSASNLRCEENSLKLYHRNVLITRMITIQKQSNCTVQNIACFVLSCTSSSSFSA